MSDCDMHIHCIAGESKKQYYTCSLIYRYLETVYRCIRNDTSKPSIRYPMLLIIVVLTSAASLWEASRRASGSRSSPITSNIRCIEIPIYRNTIILNYQYIEIPIYQITDMLKYRYTKIPICRSTDISKNRHVEIPIHPHNDSCIETLLRKSVNMVGHLCRQPLGGVPGSRPCPTYTKLPQNIRCIEKKPMYRHDAHRQSLHRNDVHIEKSIPGTWNTETMHKNDVSNIE